MLKTDTKIFYDRKNFIDDVSVVNKVRNFFCGKLISQIWQLVRDIALAINKDLAELDSHEKEECPDHLTISSCVVVDEDRALLFHIRIFIIFNEKFHKKILPLTILIHSSGKELSEESIFTFHKNYNSINLSSYITIFYQFEHPI